MLVLSVADYNATRWMGPVLAIGMAITVLAGVTLLPALVAALGPRAFPKHRKPSTIWPRIGRLVEAKPLALTVGVLVILIAGALGNLSDRGTLDFSEQFRNPPESVQGLRKLQEKFPPGQAGPVDVLVEHEGRQRGAADHQPRPVLLLDGPRRLQPRPATGAGPRHAQSGPVHGDRGGGRSRRSASLRASPIPVRSSAGRRPRSSTPRPRCERTRRSSSRSRSRASS